MTEVLHGYTLADICGMARCACAADRSMASDMDTRYNTAWSAIAEHLCTADEPPTWTDLVRTGWQAIYREVREMRHTFGQSRDDPNAEVASGKRFQQYWFVREDSPEDGFVERLAVEQILPKVRPLYRDALIALAVTGDYRAAAEMLGIEYSALNARLSTARRTFRRYWFAPEPAPPMRGTDRRVKAYDQPPQTHCIRGHEMSGGNVRMRKNEKGRACRSCEREKSAEKRARKKADALRHPVDASVRKEVS